MHLQQNIFAKHPELGINYRSDKVEEDLFFSNLLIIFVIISYLYNVLNFKRNRIIINYILL